MNRLGSVGQPNNLAFVVARVYFGSTSARGRLENFEESSRSSKLNLRARKAVEFSVSGQTVRPSIGILPER
jgi:hypothetical protein